jgi:hypothetical protein
MMITLAVTMVIGGLIFSGCNTQTRKIDYSIANGAESTQDLKKGMKEVSEELKNALNVQDWLIFKKVSEFKIRDNDIRIAELKVKMQRRGMKPDPMYRKKLNGLENVNLEMKKKLRVYSENQYEWNSYKNEFKHDLDQLGQTLTDLTVVGERDSKTTGDL